VGSLRRTFELGAVDLDVLVAVLLSRLRLGQADGSDGRVREDDAASEKGKRRKREVRDDASTKKRAKEQGKGDFDSRGDVLVSELEILEPISSEESSAESSSSGESDGGEKELACNRRTK